MKFDLKNFKLAPKDKRLLLSVAMVIVALIAFLAYTKIDGMVDKVQKEVKGLETVKSDLQEKYRQKNVYTSKTYIYKELYEKIVNNYASGVDQQTVIMKLAEIEEKTGVWLKQAGLGQTGMIYEFGKITSTNPTKTGKSVYKTDLLGYSSTVSLSYECSYEQLKEIIKLFNESSEKYRVDSVTMSYSSTEQLVTGSISLVCYAITGANRFFPPTNVDGVPIGTDNIFSSSTHTENPVDRTYLDTMKSDYDLYLNLNDAASDVNAITVGQRSDILGEDSLSSNNNTEENVYITVFGETGNYKVAYKVGDDTYPISDYEAGEDFIFGDSLDLLIISTKRNGDADLATAKLTIVNNTDVTLNVGVLNDDAENPRCVFDKMVGEIAIFE